ncbi:MAG TPA: GNAT family N-acetyltransferase [Candidatus Bathyarchaeia archaeon]|nr:GNAT family N-acetyltransferase [Candidatus Bathyarchaeia archaeon]
MIRKFTNSDLDAILRIEEDAFPKSAYNGFIFLYYAEAYPDNFLVYICDDTGKGLSEIAGYIIFYPQGHIVSIAVHSAYRRRGIGTELVEAVLKRTEGIASVEVRASNEVAKTFYKHSGFSLRTIIPRYYGNEDALVMVRTGMI